MALSSMQGIPLLPKLSGDFLRKLRERLPLWALGLEEEGQAKSMIRGCLAHAARDADFLAAGHGLALWAWQRRPLSSAFAHVLAGLDVGRPFLPEPVRRLAGAVALATGDPTDAPGRAEWDSAKAAGGLGYARAVLRRGLAEPSQRLPWLERAFAFELSIGGVDEAAALLSEVEFSGELAPLADRMRAEWAFFALPPDKALAEVETLDLSCFAWWREHLCARLMLAAGDAEGGVKRLSRLWRQAPWQTHLTLTLFEETRGPGRTAPAKEGEAAVCLYSWNKAGLLQQTLAALADSELGAARVVVLDNGSTDATARVLAEAERRFAPGAFTKVSLPVNIGAPAARNWLLSLPEVAGCGFTAFLDDDALTPRDWLTRLLGAAESHAGIHAGVVGCRIGAAEPAWLLQSADYNPFPPPVEPDAEAILAADRVRVFENCAGQLDIGLFSYTRPCLSVSGCCHLVSMDAVRAAGPFDIRFSPTQFDDLERDMRSMLAGRPAVYCGALAVRHVQHSSLARAATPAQAGNVAGNRVKLEAKYTGDELARLHRDALGLLWADLEEKTAALMERFAPGFGLSRPRA